VGSRWDTSRAEAPPQRPLHLADGGWCESGVSWSTAGVWGDLAAGSREAEPAFAFALGVARRRAVPLVGDSLGVGRRELDCGRGVREEELVARSVEVDAERKLLNPLGFGEGRGSERDAWVGLFAQTGRGASEGGLGRLEEICYVAGQVL